MELILFIVIYCTIIHYHSNQLLVLANSDPDKEYNKNNNSDENDSQVFSSFSSSSSSSFYSYSDIHTQLHWYTNLRAEIHEWANKIRAIVRTLWYYFYLFVIVGLFLIICSWVCSTLFCTDLPEFRYLR